MPTPPSGSPGWVRLAGRDLLLSELRAQPDQNPRTFEAARATSGYGQCLCAEPPLRLVIRLRAGRYHLAGWPGEGTQHHPDCPFFKLAPDLSGLSSYAQAAIKETTVGVSIRLRQPLDLRSGARNEPADDDSGHTAISRNTVTLLGLLHWLWEQAGLNRWQRGAALRRWAQVRTAVTQAAAACTVNQRPLSRALHVIAPYDPRTATVADEDFRRFTTLLTAAEDGCRRGLLLGEIRSITPTAGGMRILLTHTRIPIYTTKQLITRAAQAYRHVFARSRPHHSRQIVLILVEKTSRGHLAAVDLTAMLTSRTYIPADSSFEVLATDHLIGRGRTFIKPCRFDATDQVFPDYVLTDVANPTGLAFLEVWGLAGREDYEQRRREKEHHYQRSGAALVGWDVTTTPLAQLPLPPRRTPATPSPTTLHPKTRPETRERRAP